MKHLIIHTPREKYISFLRWPKQFPTLKTISLSRQDQLQHLGAIQAVRPFAFLKFSSLTLWLIFPIHRVFSFSISCNVTLYTKLFFHSTLYVVFRHSLFAKMTLHKFSESPLMIMTAQRIHDVLDTEHGWKTCTRKGLDITLNCLT